VGTRRGGNHPNGCWVVTVWSPRAEACCGPLNGRSRQSRPTSQAQAQPVHCAAWLSGIATDARRLPPSRFVRGIRPLAAWEAPVCARTSLSESSWREARGMPGSGYRSCLYETLEAFRTSSTVGSAMRKLQTMWDGLVGREQPEMSPFVLLPMGLGLPIGLEKGGFHRVQTLETSLETKGLETGRAGAWGPLQHIALQRRSTVSQARRRALENGLGRLLGPSGFHDSCQPAWKPARQALAG
jgi:hypothetical protein